MKKHIVVVLSALVLSFLSCEKDNNDPIVKDNEDVKYGVLKGTVGLFEGDCIPISSCQSSSFKTTVLINKISDDFYTETFVDSVLTSDDGSYELRLPEGNYRLFIRDRNEFIRDYWLSNDDFNCSRFTIKHDSVTTIDANIDHRNSILKGKIGLYEGNCMPGPGIPPCQPAPISTTVAITKPSEHFNIDLLEASVITSEKGIFEMVLPAGNYSLFIKDGDEFICDSWACPNECYCTLFEIDTDFTTTVIANINHASW